MEIHDSLNNQFKLYNYITKLNDNILQYLDNNNINVNYYCFYSKVIDNKHYILTSQTTKRTLNGYRLITICDVEKDNNIFECNDNLDIIFENIHIKITQVVDNISDIANMLGIVITNFTDKLVSDETIDYSYDYDKNILESNITTAKNVMDLIILNNFENLKELTFGFYYNQTIGVKVLPNSLQILTFGELYNQTIGINVLPNSLHILTFGRRYNQTIDVNVLPNSLHTLTFGRRYNQTIDVNVLPNSLQALTFGYSYNQTIGINVLPNSLKTLTFNYGYNRTININVLPNSLQTLTFGYNYNQAINGNALPNSLQVIYFNFYCYCIKRCKKNIIPQAFQNIVKFINIYTKN
jgi:hypothetical protein